MSSKTYLFKHGIRIYESKSVVLFLCCKYFNQFNFKKLEEMISKEEYVFLCSDSDRISISINWMSA